MTPRRVPAPSPWWRLALFVAGYAAAVWVGLHLLVESSRLSAFWPAGGIALAALLTTPRRQWGVLLPLLFAAHVGNEFLAGFLPVPALAYPAVALFEVTLGAWLIQRNFSAPMSLATGGSVLALVGWVGLVAIPISSSLAAAVPAGEPEVFYTFAMRWRLWWTVDFLGILITAPLLLAGPAVVRWWREADTRPRTEAGLALLGILVLSFAILGSKPDHASVALSLLALPYPLFVWLALRAGSGGVAIAIASMSGIAAWHAGHGEGPFMLFSSDPTRQVLILQVYLASVVVPSLFLAGAAQDAQHAASCLREIFDHSSEAIYLVGVRRGGDFVYEAANPLAQEVLNTRVGSLVGRSPREVMPEPVAEQLLANWRHCLEAGRPLTVETSLDFGGGPRIWQSNLVPIRGRLGSFRRLAGFARDVTEVRESERARGALERQLRHSQKMEAIGRLAGGLAHEFNNVLTAMVGHAELLAGAIPPGSRQQESTEAILEGGARAAALVRQVLTFSRRDEEPRAVVRVQTVVREAVRLVAATVPATIELRQSIDPSCPAVLADPTQVYQALINLVTNAVYSMRDRPGVLEIGLTFGPIEPEVTTLNAQLPSGTYVCLSISDTGAGMSAQTLEHVYEPFFTTKPEGEGTGLGLPVVLGIMQNHEGGMAIDSEVGKGTRVRLYFPAIAAGSETLAAQESPPPRGSGQRVMLVDDEPGILNLARRQLEGLGYAVTPQRSPEAALEAFRAAPNTFAAVITDLTMPGMTGVKLAADVRRLHPGVAIVLTTGKAPGEGEEQEWAALGELLPKPYNQSSLGHALARALGKIAV